MLLHIYALFTPIELLVFSMLPPCSLHVPSMLSPCGSMQNMQRHIAGTKAARTDHVKGYAEGGLYYGFAMQQTGRRIDQGLFSDGRSLHSISSRSPSVCSITTVPSAAALLL